MISHAILITAKFSVEDAPVLTFTLTVVCYWAGCVNIDEVDSGGLFRMIILFCSGNRMHGSCYNVCLLLCDHCMLVL